MVTNVRRVAADVRCSSRTLRPAGRGVGGGEHVIVWVVVVPCTDRFQPNGAAHVVCGYCQNRLGATATGAHASFGLQCTTF